MQGGKVIIVAVTGVARSGKDTIAGILCRRFGFTRIALADGLRSAFRDLDGPTWELTKELESKGVTTRRALQFLGTEGREQAQCPYVWLDVLATKVAYLAEIHPEPRRRFVVPDLRFPNEAGYLQEFAEFLGGDLHVWRVKRSGAGLSGELSSHASEWRVEEIEPDLTIVNDGPMEYLEAIVANFAEGFDED